MKKFTDNQIKNLKPEEKTYRITEGNGFYIRVTPQGKKAWLYRYHYSGKDQTVTLGYYPTMTLSQARTAYQELFDLWQSGVDPKAHMLKLLEAKTDTVKKFFFTFWNGSHSTPLQRFSPKLSYHRNVSLAVYSRLVNLTK